jgi:DNA-binding XRE family transcriptional regulator
MASCIFANPYKYATANLLLRIRKSCFTLHICNRKFAKGNEMNFKELRMQANLSVAELASKLEVNETTVYRWEAGDTKPRLDQFFKLQEVLETESKSQPFKQIKEGA